MNLKTELNQTSPDWRLLYRLGAIGAWFSALLIPVAIVSHLLWPPPPWTPGAASDWFSYIGSNPLAGLLNLDLLLEIGLILSVPLYIALFLVLYKTNRSLTVLATATALLGIVLHILSNAAWEMLLLSNAFAEAGTDEQRAVLLAAGEASLSAYYGMVFQVSYILGYLTYILIGYVMLYHRFFGKPAAYLAIVTGIAGFGFYLPEIGTIISVLVVLLVGIWNVIVGWKLFQFNRFPRQK